MAIVRTSKQLISDIRDKVQTLRNQAYNVAFANATTQVDLKHTRSLFVEHETWGKERHAEWRDKLPLDWLRQVSSCSIQIRNNGAYLSFIEIHKMADTFCPPTTVAYTLQLPIEVDRLDELAAIYPEIAQVKAVHESNTRRTEFNTKWADTEQRVAQFFAAFPSINKALDAEPSMRLYVPAEVLRRLDEEAPERRKPAKELDVDAGKASLNTAGLAAVAVEVQLQTAAQRHDI